MSFFSDLWQMKKAFGKMRVSSVLSSADETVTLCFAFENKGSFFREFAFMAEHWSVYLVLSIGLIGFLCVYTYFSEKD